MGLQRFRPVQTCSAPGQLAGEAHTCRDPWARANFVVCVDKSDLQDIVYLVEARGATPDRLDCHGQALSAPSQEAEEAPSLSTCPSLMFRQGPRRQEDRIP